jgi:RpiB/LacA/LacB family sugar-phosphate isomerase
MIIYIGADHRGFYLKEVLKSALKDEGYEVMDLGNAESDANDDYPDFAAAVAEKVAGTGSEVRGILICSSGVGVDITANKFDGVRSALAMSVDHIRAARNDDDVNVLSLASDYVKPDDAIAIAHAFLATPFEAESRRVRRLKKIADIETKN